MYRFESRTMVQSSSSHSMDDAFFVRPDALGVADGVGGWRVKGVNAGEYARQLMALCALQPHRDPCERICRAHEALTFVYPNLVGTTTACVATLDGDTLHVTNVGDSQLVVLRAAEHSGQWAVVCYTELQYNPNGLGRNGRPVPGQLGKDPVTGSTFEQPTSMDVAVQADDVVMLFTDGVRDHVPNLSALVCKTLAHTSKMTTVVGAVREAIHDAWNDAHSDDCTFICARIIANGSGT